MNLFDGTIKNLEHGLQYSSLKNDTIAQNLANVDTPNYKAQTVQFSDFLDDARSSFESTRTDERHLPFSSGSSTFPISARQNVTYNHNGNSVDMDKEMSELAKNQIHYEAMIDRVNGKFDSISTALQGGA